MAFNNYNLRMVSDALDIAEDVTGNFYKFSLGQWKRHHYDVKTLSFLIENEISSHAFAILKKCTRVVDGFEPKTKNRDFYFICLQDNHILRALRRDSKLSLPSLLVYIFTHELVHIVRFCNFSQRFDAPEKEREREEKIVHTKTFAILKDLSIPKLDYILDSYHGHRVCDMVVS